MSELDKKVKDAIKVIKMLSMGADGAPIEVSYSGGKDSDVILRLTQIAYQWHVMTYSAVMT